MNNYCTKCGSPLIDGGCPKCSEAQNAAINPNNERFKRFFMSPREKFVCALGNGYIQNFLTSGFIGNGFAIVSDKRVYFKGQAFEMSGQGFKSKTVASTVDLKDVTGTEVRTVNPINKLIAGIVGVVLGLPTLLACSGWYSELAEASRWTRTASEAASKLPWCYALIFLGLLLLIMGAVLLYFYFSNKKTLLTIMFGGGGVAFPLNWFSARESENFQKMLRIAKDNAVEEAEQSTANTMREVMSNVVGQSQVAVSAADELAKYAQLYKEGLISEQEFSGIKAKVLNN